MMISSLSTIDGVQKKSKKSTRSEIIQVLKNDTMKFRVFLVVEGKDDKAFYQKFLDEYVIVREAVKDDLHDGGRDDILEIVHDILDNGHTQYIFGIVDTDYYRYSIRKEKDENVFTTDCRDMEMMVLKEEQIRQVLFSLHSEMRSLWNTHYPIVSYMGQLRLVNYLFKLGCRINKNVKINNIYNKGRIVSNPRKKITDMFKADMKNKFAGKSNLPQRINYRLALIVLRSGILKFCDFYNIVRGHDVFDLINARFNSRLEFQPKFVWEKLTAEYTYDMFKTTHLYEEIKEWQNLLGVNALK